MKSRIGWIVSVMLAITVFLAACSEKESNSANSAKNTNTNTAQSSQTPQQADKVTVNIGLQQSLDPMRVTKEKRFFEEEFAKLGAKVNWLEFQSGALYFEAMAAKRLDLGLAASAPVVVGQAANIDFKIIALTTDGLNDSSLLVSKNSSIKSLQDLKGKKVAVAREAAPGIFYIKCSMRLP
ncbi:PhnD/SsuA/transferrin family substrate-binding protein [Cohnella faecalis]|uniref:SsuA/THI5-like domain-containing protein n=1 Tax=Cohnella faecalis TaxID=2315694 RepID=A0A398CLC7_9BACL|nr:PhnD/SsuA/transferrin family substrate-binding protein [Cohnella faecalis]RIE00441.1 hypothetical protein D3H35_28960 [Cohnella faecalis]